ncbi:MAG: Fic/DOC family N-terminal domain-containing protein [Paracoccaceae bacterium]
MAVAYHQGQFPPGAFDWPQLLPLIGPANAAVARYEGVLHGIPNPNVLLSPLTTQEAVLSSRIEGTQATIGEVLEFEAGDSRAMKAPRKRPISTECELSRGAGRASGSWNPAAVHNA